LGDEKSGPTSRIGKRKVKPSFATKCFFLRQLDLLSRQTFEKLPTLGEDSLRIESAETGGVTVGGREKAALFYWLRLKKHFISEFSGNENFRLSNVVQN